MTTSHRRITLLSGASLAALGFASPAFADPNYPGPAPHDVATTTGTHPGTMITYAAGTAQDTIDICAIADNPSCFLGVNNQGAGAQTALVTDAPTGQILLYAPAATDTVDLNVTVATGDSAEIGAIAISTTAGTADATLQTAISMTASGNDDIHLAVTNNGNLLIDALAVGTDTVAAADASATLNYGIYQIATSTGGDVLLEVVNNGNLTIAATAVANRAPAAHANAFNY
jgi:hypothetical protein